MSKETMFRKPSMPEVSLGAPLDSERPHHTHRLVRREEGLRAKNLTDQPLLRKFGPTDVASITYRKEEMPEFTQALADAGYWRERNRWADYLGFILHICFSSTSLLLVFKEMAARLENLRAGKGLRDLTSHLLL